MTSKQARRLAKGLAAQRATMAEYAPERATLFDAPDADRTHVVHIPRQAFRNLSPKSGFNARRCS